MTARRAVWEVARREIVERARSRTTRVAFAIFLVAVVGGAIAVARIGKGTPTDSYGLVGQRAVAVAPALRLQAQAAGRKAHVHRLRDRAAASRAVRDGEVDVAIVDGRLLVKASRSDVPVGIAQQAVAAQGTLMRLREAGLTQPQALDALAQRPLPVDVLEPAERDAERNRDVLFAGLFALYMALILLGTSVASSVTEEKSSRVVELLLTTVSPRRLLAGKVLGVGLLGLAEVIVVGSAGLAAGAIAGGEGLPSGAPATVALAVGWFGLGFAFYSVVFAAVGALVSRQEDLGAAITPLTVLLSASYFAALAAVDDPNGTWAQIAAMLPPLSPMVVPARVVLGDMGAIALLAAIALEVIATVLLVLAAARVYERAILRIGAPVGLGGVLHDRARHEPARPRAIAGLLRWAAVLVMVGSILLDGPLPVGLIAAGLLLTAAHHYGKPTPPRPSG